MGGLIQLVATGDQDVYLTGDPQITFFKAIYKRHTNFSMECIEQKIGGSIADNGKATIIISKSGDLVQEVFLETQTENAHSIVNNADVYALERLVSSCVLSIGGQQIDVHNQRWWRLFSELYHNDAKKTLYSKIVNSENDTQTAYLPFIFFFNRNPGLALPLVALQHHEVTLDITWTSVMDKHLDKDNVRCWANYIFLDKKERRLFAEKPHDYLIEQVQFTGHEGITANESTKIRLFYKHPVKELVWCFAPPNGNALDQYLWNMTIDSSVEVGADIDAYKHSSRMSTANAKPHESLGVVRMWNNHYYGEVTDGPLSTFSLLFNGAERFGVQDGKYFNQIQSFYHHSGNPVPGIYSYSFALKPEGLQPSGACNFSRIDNVTVVPTMKSSLGGLGSMTMYAINYNILAIKSGLAGLVFSE